MGIAVPSNLLATLALLTASYSEFLPATHVIPIIYWSVPRSWMILWAATMARMSWSPP